MNPDLMSPAGLRINFRKGKTPGKVVNNLPVGGGISPATTADSHFLAMNRMPGN
jgi:hypothetical protein